MPSTKTAAAQAESLRELYREVSSHLDACEFKAEYLSDTWSHTLKQKGRLHSFEDMVSMLDVGNGVNSWIDDFNYLNDESILDAKDAVLRRILKLGPSEFGRPRKQLKVGGREVSSQFVQQSLFAARLIEAIEARGISEPVIMEIGGGLGGLARILRAYYGDRLTYYAVDLPETLAIQEWYLRACFPEAPTAFKAGRARAEFKRGGLNFINAYALESQDIGFDAAVNIDSMQEMNEDAVRAYIRYFEANASERGLFYFQNHFGHSSAGIREPSDYPLDARWTLAAAEIVPQIEVCSEGIQLRMILHRTKSPENADTRRLVLRALWNSFMSGWPAHSPRLVAALAALPSSLAPAAAVTAIGKAFRRHGVPLADAAFKRLLTSFYWASDRDFVGAYDRRPRPGVTLSPTLSRADAVWRAQSSLLALMKKAAGGKLGASAARAQAARLVAPLPALAAGSDYWSAYAAAILLSLGRERAGGGTLSKAIRRSDNQHWLVRFAHLAQAFGLDAVREQALAKLLKRKLDYFVDLKTTEILAAGRADEARGRLEASFAEAGADAVKLWPLARTAARAGLTALAERAARAACEGGSDGSDKLLGVLKCCPKGAPRPLLEELARARDESSPFRGFILMELGELELGLELAKRALESAGDDYFRLGQLGRLLQSAGCDDLADRALERSLAARPKTFLHHDFVGDIYLSAGRFARARRQFEAALRLRPYPRHIQAKKLHCELPASLRESAVFGRPSGWSLVFQRRHDFYHDIGPTTK